MLLDYCLIMYSVVNNFNQYIFHVFIYFFFCILSFCFYLKIVSLVRSIVFNLCFILYYTMQDKAIETCQHFIYFQLYIEQFFISYHNFVTILYQVFYAHIRLKLIELPLPYKLCQYCNPLYPCFTTRCHTVYILYYSYLYRFNSYLIYLFLNSTANYCHDVCTITAHYTKHENKSTNILHYLQCTRLIKHINND